jgi:hypothetical protein
MYFLVYLLPRARKFICTRIEIRHAFCALRFRSGRSAFRYAPCAMLFFLCWAGVVNAQGLLQGVSGYFDFVFNASSSTFTDSSGNTIKTSSTIYNPRFSLNVNTQIFPNLQLSAGGLIEGSVSEATAENIKVNSKGMNLRPYVNLILNTAPYTFGLGYTRREEYVKAGSGPSVTNINEEYDASFSWKPDGLPTLDVLYTRKNFFDIDREIQDTTDDSVLMGLKYTYKNLDMKYQANYSDHTDNLTELNTKDLTQTGRVAYSDSFLDRRVSFNTAYTITRDDTTITSSGTGEVSFQIFALSGLSINFDIVPPQTQHTVTLNTNPALIDGDLTASAGINIGLPPPGGDTKPRNIGLDLLNVSEVNRLLVWVDRELPQNIANFFSWDIYTSSDNLTWNFYRTIAPASFGFQFQNRFELGFPTVKTRYIKVVTRPLIPVVIDASKFPNIFITEMQASITKSVQGLKRKTHSTSQYFNADAKTRILNIPSLYYDFSFFYSRTDPSGVYQYTLSNGLSLNHQFNQVFSASARFARDDSVQQDQKITDYIYNASLTATPIRTLTHSLVFGGRNETTSAGSENTYNVLLNNTAQLYQGVDVYLSGGVNSSEKPTKEKQFGTTVTFGSNIVPHRNLTFNVNISSARSDQKGGGKPEFSSYTRSVDMNASFTPFSTLYLYGSLTISSRTDAKTSYLQSYSVNWSPFPGGSLQFNFGYNESLRSEDNGRETNIGPGLTWKITNRATLNMSYQVARNKSLSLKEETNSFSSNLRILF